MATTVDVLDAANQWPKLLALAKAGNEVILAEGGRPVARLTAMETTANLEEPAPTKRIAGLGRVAGLHEGACWISDDFDDPLPDEFWCPEDDILLKPPSEWPKSSDAK